MTVVATAGHVDHGKSSLVSVLTGVDPDRWEEEKVRGLTIDLGFGSMKLRSGRELSFIDVPGHIRFIRNMLAGVGAVDGSLFVVSAVEGWKPQSEEHLRILEMLGIKRGIVALTKLDLVDEDLLMLAEMDVEEHVAGTFLEGAPVIGVSAHDRTGLDELGVALDLLVDEVTKNAEESGTPRLWVDRSFAPAGAGTVVTGTLVGGSINVGDELTSMPGNERARIRSLQSHHRQVNTIKGGNRAAVNLTGVSHHSLGRGHVLVNAGDWHETSTVDAELTVLEKLDHPLTRRGAYVAYLGSAALQAKIRVLGDAEELAPGESGAVRLYLNRPIIVLPGDRFVLRESGREETVGGGEILDVDPVLSAVQARPDRDINRVVSERGWVDVDHLARLTGQRFEPTVGNWVVSGDELARSVETVTAAISDAGALGLDVASLDERQRAILGIIDEAIVEAGRVVLGEAPDPLADHPWVKELNESPWTPPGPDGIDRGEVRELVRRGLVIESEGIFFTADAVERAAKLIAKALASQPSGLTVSEVRKLLDTTRKFALPLLARLDQTGVTRRRDNVRIGGPRLPAAG